MSSLTVERLETYSPQDAADLGVLRNALSSDRSTNPLTEERLRDFTDRQDRALIAARAIESGRIVGCETLVKIPVPESEDDKPDGFAWLGFVATHPDFRGSGILKNVALEGLLWCANQNIESIKFTSNSNNPERQAARGFYIKYGAVIVAKGVSDKDTDFFNWNVETGINRLTS